MAETTFHSITLPGQDTARVPLTAVEFNTTTTYQVRDYCTYQGQLYQCTTAHTAGAWNSEHFTAVNVGEQINTRLITPPTTEPPLAERRVGDLWIDVNTDSQIINIDSQPISGSTNVPQSGGTFNLINNVNTVKANKAMLTGDFSSTSPYSVNDLCIYNGYLYRCIVDIPTGAAWNASKWQATTIEEELGRIESEDVDLAVITEQFGDSESYAVGDYVFHASNGVMDLYKCINAVSDTSVWNSSYWRKTILSSELKDKENALNDITSIGEYADLTNVEMTAGSYLTSSGSISSNEAFLLSDYIELPEGVNSITVNRDVYSKVGTKYPQNQMVFWYDENKQYQGIGTNTYSDNLLTSTHSSWFSCKYIRVNFSRHKVHNFIKFNYYYDLKYKKHFISGDLNDITEPGIYIIPNSSQVTNFPISEQVFAVLTNNLAPFNDHASQVLTTSYGQFTRTRINGVWKIWKHMDFGSNVIILQNTSITNINDLEPNKIYLLSNNSSNFSNLPYTGFLGTIITFSGTGSNSSGNCQMAISSTNRLFIRRFWGSTTTWNNWTEFTNPNSVKEIIGELFSFTGAFESAQQSIQTSFVLQPNTSYIIKCYNHRTGIINVFGKSNSANFKRIYPFMDSIRFTNDSTARYLMLYNPNGELDDINIKVFADNSISIKNESIPKVYYVKQDAQNGDYTSLSKCLMDLKDDNDPKIIEIWEGDYDIYAEYVELYNAGLLEVYTGNDPSIDYFPYCVWVPKNTHIIGKGIVRLKWTPDPTNDDITPVQCQCISPLNVAATATIENVEVYCKNGRYCLHNDGFGKFEFTGAIQKYINVKFYKDANDVDPISGLEYGFNQTTGFGIDRSMQHIYENCVFSNMASNKAFYGHSRNAVNGTTLIENRCSNITLINCIFNSNISTTETLIKFGNGSNANLHIPVQFNNCYFGNGQIALINESSSAQVTYPNAFDITFVNCGNYKINISDPDNKYLPKSYDNLLPEINIIDDITSTGDYLDLSTVEMTAGSYLKTNGTIGQNDSFLLSDYIELPEGVNSITVNRDVYSDQGKKYPQTYMVFWYDAEKVYKGTGTSTYSDNLLTSSPSSWFSYKYVRINFSKYKVHNFVKFNYYYDLKYKKHIVSGDFNDITDPGVYMIPNANNITNKPVMDSTVAFLTVNVAPFNNYESQMLITSHGQYTRININGTWREWIHSDFGSNGVKLENTTITDLNDLIPNRIYLLTANPSNYTNLPYTGFLGTIMTFSGYGANISGNSQMAISSTNRLFVRRSWGTNATWNDWTEFTNPEFKKEITGELFSFTGAFESARQQLNTQFVMQPNTTYIVKFYGYRTGNVNVFGLNNTNNFKRVRPWTDSVRITNDGTARYLILYNPNGELDNVSIKVFTNNSIALKTESVPKVYRVTKYEQNGDYTSLSKCLIDLKDDQTPKTIEIWEGDYDLYSEYQELYTAGLLEKYQGTNPSSEYFDYCVWVPENTHIVGKGIVRLKWEPTVSQLESDEMTGYQTRCISPLNVAASCTIENVEVYCKNGRYCLHNDGLGKPEFTGATQHYINCRFYKYENDTDSVNGLTYGFLPTTGFGIDRAMHHIYDDCSFYNYASERAFYGHSRISAISSEAQSSDITLNNCVIDSAGSVCVKFGNSASNRTAHIRVMFNSCYIAGLVRSQLESNASSDCANGFDVQYLNCGTVTMKIIDPDNPYPPKAYNTTLTLTY